MTTLAAFLGGWELLLIAAVLGVLVGVPLLILAIVLFIVNRQKKAQPSRPANNNRPDCWPEDELRLNHAD